MKTGPLWYTVVGEGQPGPDDLEPSVPCSSGSGRRTGLGVRGIGHVSLAISYNWASKACSMIKLRIRKVA